MTQSDLGIIDRAGWGPDVTYDEVRALMGGEPYWMNLNGPDAKLVVAAVNQGIDSRLEACNGPNDKYEVHQEMLGPRMECSVSPESLPVLLRRLYEAGDEASERLAEDILESLKGEGGGD
jgi:hypothetical protein